MTDVVTRLKEYVTLPLIGRGHRGRLIQASMRDAADEIERLRAALVQIATVCTDNAGEDCNHRMALNFVRSVAADAVDQQRTEPSK